MTDAAWVLDEDDALEVLAYLVTAARTQVDEAAEYGPMRLLTAARTVAGLLAQRASEPTATFAREHVDPMPALAVPREGRDEYVARLDALCAELGTLLAGRYVAGRDHR